MDIRTVYTDENHPGVELWDVPSGLSIRNGKPGKPLTLECPANNYEISEMIASAFFKGLSYNS